MTVVAGDYPGAARTEELAPNLTVHRMGSRADRLPARRLGVAARARARRRRRARGRQRHHLPDAAVAAAPARRARPPRPPRPLRRRAGPRRRVRRVPRRDAAAAAALPRHHVPHDLRRRPARPRRRSASRPSASTSPTSASRRRPSSRARGRREPRLLYLGRLKQYKRIELLLDVLEAIPGAHLDIAGEGDHRPAIEAEIAARGLGDRVTLHGHVSEAEKAALLSRAWVNLTASSAEGWCLTVMEAAAYGDAERRAARSAGCPSRSSTGRPACWRTSRPELAGQVRRLVERRRAARAARRRGARARARGFTWERTAGENLAVLDARGRRPSRVGLRASLAGSETLKAAGLAAATLAVQRDRAALHRALRAAARRRRLRLAGGADLHLPDPRRAGLRRSRWSWRARRRPARSGSGAQLAATLAAWRRTLVVALPGRERRRGAAARADRRPAVRRGGVGGGRDAADRLPVAAALDRARRAPGRARLPRGRLVDRARGDRPAGVRPDPRDRPGWA